MTTRSTSYSALALALGFLLLPMPAGTSDGLPVYRFEPEGSAVLERLGVECSRDPKMYLRASGALYMLAVTGRRPDTRLELFISHDAGDSFDRAVPVSEEGARINSHGENSPSLAFGDTEVYALWEQTVPEGGTDLMFARSMNFARTFEKPVRVTDKSSRSSNAFSTLAVSPSGEVFAVWLDGREPKTGPPGTSAVYLARSADRGASFGPNRRIAPGVCPCCRPSIAFGPEGEIYVAWRHVFEDDVRDIAISASYDGGVNFSEPARVSADNWKVRGCPHTGPVMGHRGKRLYIAWYSDGTGENPGIRVAFSDDRARGFRPPAIVSGAVLDPNHPSISIDEQGRLLLVFQGRDEKEREGWGNVRAYLVEIGDHLSAPLPIPGARRSISYPAVASGGPGRVFVAWTEPAEGGNRVVLTRGRRSPG